METQVERLVQDDQGVSPEGQAQDKFEKPASGSDSPTVPEEILGEPKGADGLTDAEYAEKYREVPPELRPDRNGKPPELTERLMAKLRSHYFTVRHPVLANCGHKMDQLRQPRTGCENCWWQWFNTHAELVEVTDQFYRTQGRGPLIAMRGRKYVKMFFRFMSTVAHMKAEVEAQEKRNESIDQKAEPVVPAATEGRESGEGNSEAPDQG